MNSQFWQSYNLMFFCEFCLVSIALLELFVFLLSESQGEPVIWRRILNPWLFSFTNLRK